MKLYDYYRSSAAYRVRITLNLKRLEYEAIPISLLDGEQFSENYLQLNPNQRVPCLDTEHGTLSQSLAIIEYLDELHPQPALLPADPWQKAQCRSLSLLIACDIHPLNNLAVLNYLNSEWQIQQTEKMIWYHHWLKRGFTAFEHHLMHRTMPTDFCCGDTPTLADICLIPQVYNALRFDFDLTPFPLIQDIHRACEQLPAFQQAHPDRVHQDKT
ncbi:maleylacetoacetate isomerase [Photobacterium jeanii]|uniref:Maleylacetoacetate isomerase n=1 Tax=Photobacterium jeanii TaxID=858640 RepID=A0A178K1R7_9GAMM|nr:maleylacetoacetate isomerase [Photobacterium jeanii]OAN11047.1 maleylacetoacetate isomerase [Photobacterium jeanii]PST90561.1 maleylacetoacetate isomerase [Photobacterium jeanii]